MTLEKPPRGKSAAKYAELQAAAQGELDALKYTTAFQHQRIVDALDEAVRQLEKARGLLADRPEPRT